MLDNNECWWCGRKCEEELLCRKCKETLDEKSKQAERRQRMQEVKSLVCRGGCRRAKNGKAD